MVFYSHQVEAVKKMKNGCILWGDVGTGKSRTALLYFYTKVCGGDVDINGSGSWGAPLAPRDLFIITTAKKRDSREWERECVSFSLSDNPEASVGHIKVTVDSWNNIKKYTNVSGAFFIFDEQRVSGWGAWTKAFLKICNKNKWILLSATPGDTWKDYIPVFIANGFYRTKGEFEHRHCLFDPYLNFPKVVDYVDTPTLEMYRRSILVRMSYVKTTIPKHMYIKCQYNRQLYSQIMRERWNPFANEPIENISQLCYLLRKVANIDPSRVDEVSQIVTPGVQESAIIFYNFDYELELLRNLFNTEFYKDEGYIVAEWNGHKHDPIPTSDFWVYLVQYNAGAEGWNCITTDTMIFFSQSYSYRMTTQAAGRIDRLNTPYETLYYYHLKSMAPIDVAIARALSQKKDFNESTFVRA